MNIEEKSVRTLRITDIKGLDPVTVYLENFEVGQGRLTAVCYGFALNYYWGGMGKMKLEEFILECSPCYLVQKFENNIVSEIRNIYVSKRERNYIEKIVICIQDALRKLKEAQ